MDAAPGTRHPAGATALWAFLTYFALTLVMTWPLAAGLTRDVPGDLGDALLNMWILGWGAESLPRVLTGNMTIREVWNANIFHPDPLALGFSEHLFGQVLQIAPVYHATGNLILCYNLLYLLTFSLSGLAMFLLVRDVTGNSAAAFLAGIVYAFLPYRIAQIPHIQSLSSQWMPLALFGFRRFIRSVDTGNFKRDAVAPLLLATAAFLMQNWSCGYYLLFFPPFLGLFLLHQMWTAGRLRDVRVWGGLTASAVVVVAGTAPFLALYVATQRTHAFERPLAEIIGFSADVYGYLTAAGALSLWGGVLRFTTKPENEVFLGLVPYIIGVYAVLVLGVDAWRSTSPRDNLRGWRRVLVIVLFIVGAAISAGFVAILFTGGFISSVWGVPIRASNMRRLAIEIVAIAAVLLALMPRLREFATRIIRTNVAFAALGTLLACWLSLGPLPMSGGRRLAGLGLYSLLHQYVPGFDGLRVPARFAMVAGLFLALLTGLGAARLYTRRRGNIIVAIAALLFLVEAAAIPHPLNVGSADPRLPDRIYPARDAPPVYHAIARLPTSSVILELPLGDPSWELRYVYYSTVHWRRLVNGYSGGFPRGYQLRSARLYRLPLEKEEAWRAVTEAGATHVVVHRNGFSTEEAAEIAQWLQAHGARVVGEYGDDVMYEFEPGRPLSTSSARLGSWNLATE